MFEYLIPNRLFLYPDSCLTFLAAMPEASVDSCVVDPPYGLEFMGKEWDGSDGFRRALNANDTARPNVFGRLSRTSPEYRTNYLFQEFSQRWASAVLRVLKPGAHLLSFGSTRTYHRMACAVEDAGFVIRDQVQWLHGQGMPKGKNLDGAHKGWGTTLKPASEPIVLAQKPFVETVAQNVARFGTGAMNIDACRVQIDAAVDDPRLGGQGTWSTASMAKHAFGKFAGDRVGSSPLGRWPANVVHDGSSEVLAGFPDSKGQQGDVRGTEPSHTGDQNTSCYGEFARVSFVKREDNGSAARFFYCAKATASERDGSRHPTIKPLALMRWLVRLITPPNGLVLDPFAGTGTTGEAAYLEGFRAILCEQDPQSQADIRKRLAKIPPCQP